MLMRGDPAFLANLAPPSPPKPLKRNSLQQEQQQPPLASMPQTNNNPSTTSDALVAKKRAQASANMASPFPANVANNGVKDAQIASAGSKNISNEGQMVMVTLRGNTDGYVLSMKLPSTFSQFLVEASQQLGSGDLTRVYSDGGVPVCEMADIVPGQKLVVHASAKGQFESWSFGLVIRRR